MSRATGGRAIDPDDLERFRERLAVVAARQGRFEHLLRSLMRIWCGAVGWRTEVVLHAALPGNGIAGAGCIVTAAPHRAWIDPFLLLGAWPRDAARLVWLADGRTVTGSWWRRHLLPRLGVIPIGGRGGPRAYAELAAEVLASGHAVAVFPEVGPPSPPDQARSISAGFAYLALRAGAPVVPVVLGGTHRIVRGSNFSVDVLGTIEVGTVLEDPFSTEGRDVAHALADRYDGDIASILPGRTAEADACAPTSERWRWLGTLFG